MKLIPRDESKRIPSGYSGLMYTSRQILAGEVKGNFDEPIFFKHEDGELVMIYPSWWTAPPNAETIASILKQAALERLGIYT